MAEKRRPSPTLRKKVATSPAGRGAPLVMFPPGLVQADVGSEYRVTRKLLAARPESSLVAGTAARPTTAPAAQWLSAPRPHNNRRRRRGSTEHALSDSLSPTMTATTTITTTAAISVSPLPLRDAHRDEDVLARHLEPEGAAPMAGATCRSCARPCSSHQVRLLLPRHGLRRPHPSRVRALAPQRQRARPA